MTPLKRACIPPEENEMMIRELHKKWLSGMPEIRKCFNADDPQLALNMIRDFTNNEVVIHQQWKNEVYQVAVRECGQGSVHLSIKRNDRKPIHDWRDLQEIKNQLVGPECEGVELYPAESRRVDTANQYHLWCSTDTKFRFQFGFNDRFVTEDSLAKSVNRPF